MLTPDKAKSEPQKLLNNNNLSFNYVKTFFDSTILSDLEHHSPSNYSQCTTYLQVIYLCTTVYIHTILYNNNLPTYPVHSNPGGTSTLVVY